MDHIEMANENENEIELELPQDSLEEFETLVLTEDVLKESVTDELLWQAKTGLNHDTLCGAIETIIFMNDRPVPIIKIKNLIDEDLPLKTVHESLQRLQAEYEQKHHGIRLLEVAEGYQFRTKATFSKYVQDIFKVNSLVLSPTALEVLAILAYKQPVSKVEVDKIRGVDSGHIVRALMDKRLVRVVGRSEELGRPVLYGTTPEFLEVFNLANIAELPPEHELDEMSKVTNVGKIADIKSIVHNGNKARFKFDEIEELDQLTESIKNISADTAFTASLKIEEKKRTSEEGVEIKSAFDLLEEFINKRQISEQNLKAQDSQIASNIIEPKVISDLELGPFNIPLLDDEEFEMIDLDTGLPLSELPPEKTEPEIELMSESEEEELSKALDLAFAKMTSFESFEDELESDDLIEKNEHLEEITHETITKAHDLDLDLSFLNEDIDN